MVASDGYPAMQSLFERAALLANERLLNESDAVESAYLRGAIQAYTDAYDLIDRTIVVQEEARKYAGRERQRDATYARAANWGSPFYNWRDLLSSS